MPHVYFYPILYCWNATWFRNRYKIKCKNAVEMWITGHIMCTDEAGRLAITTDKEIKAIKIRGGREIQCECSRCKYVNQHINSTTTC